MKPIFLSKTEIDADVDNALECLDSHRIHIYPLANGVKGTIFDTLSYELRINWGRLLIERTPKAFNRLCQTLYEISGWTLSWGDSFERRRQLYFEMWNDAGLDTYRFVRWAIQGGIQYGHLLDTLTDEETKLLNGGAQSFLGSKKELVDVLASQDLSGEEIRQFVKKVFNL